jgi:hypothetical protein
MIEGETAMLGLCERIAQLDGSIAVVLLVENGEIVEQRSRQGAEFVKRDRAEDIVVQRLMMLYLSKMHEGFLGRFEYTVSRYENADILMIEVPSLKKRSMLIVAIKRPYDMDSIMRRITDVIDTIVA